MRSLSPIALLTLLLLSVTGPLQAQVIHETVNNTAIYSFLDELAADGIIELNSAVKPYSRETIKKFLAEAQSHGEELTVRQAKELDLYIIDFVTSVEDSKVHIIFNPATVQYKDSLFKITLTPLLGFTAGAVTDRGKPVIAWKNGAKIFGSYGNWGFYAALRDNHQDPLTGKAIYLTRERGGHIKGLTDFSEMTGGISYSWRWADISFIRDSPVWGSGYAGTNILSGRAPAFMQLRLHIKPVKWMEMTWFHGWLNSMVVDSTRSYLVTNAYGTDYREVYHHKFFAANIFTITPVQRLHVSLGNSVVYSDPRLAPGYLMPLFFYKSVDHDVNSGIDNSNSQMFIDISSYQVKHLHLYGTLFIDEMSIKRFTTPDFNYFSWKGGFRTGNFPFLPDLWVAAECTFTYPLTYQHYVPVLTFENQGYNMGHYLRDNSRSFWTAIDYKPLRGMNIRLWYEYAERGPDYQSIGGDRVGLPYIGTLEWKSISGGIGVSYLITGGVVATASYSRSNITKGEDWTAPHLFGLKHSFNAGIVWGF